MVRNIGDSRLRLGWYVLATLLAVFTYFFGLDSQQIPKIGDEYPYEHITRLTAESGHWLPLQSNLDHMRNTKPPLLFWQGIASTHWGKEWNLWDLRWPGVIYTLLTALLVFLLARRLSGELETGFIAALTFLAFFSTYRFGRPFLVNPGETFWLFLPFFTLLYWRPAAFESTLVPLLLGAEIGVGLLYKSFALLAPVGLGVAWWYLHYREYRLRAFFVKDAWKLVLLGALALGMFGLWFLLDPEPQAVWREFIVGENVGKFDAHGSYLGKLLWGGSSVWALLVGYPLNAGLLAVPVAVLFFISFRRRKQLTDAEKMLWIFMAAFFLVFSLPSQRSARYLLEAMPAVAVLCALNWQRIGRWAFVASLVLTGGVLTLLAFLSVRLEHEVSAGPLYWASYWALLAATGVLLLAAVFVGRFTRPAANVVMLLALLCLAAFLRPFDGDLGSYSIDAQQYAKGKEVAVPCDFRAKDEGYRFLLPGIQTRGYNAALNLTSGELADHYSLFVVQLPLSEQPCAGCRVIGQRLEIRGRQSEAELKEMLKGNVFQHLFVKELLVEAPNAGGARTPLPEACR
jgi:4-amino-4-deoxy-L-arabinose transferase-like glycosyltransferase